METKSPINDALRYIVDCTELGRVVDRNSLLKFGLSNDLVDVISSAQQELVTRRDFNRNGLFIVVSGIDKSGKETHAFNPLNLNGVRSVKDFLTNRGLSVTSIMQPSYDTKIGNLVFEYLKGDDGNLSVDPDLAWVLWSLDRAQHNCLLAESLSSKYSVVLSKRWTESNLVYQQALGVDVNRVLRFEKNIIKPDLVLVLDITLDTFLERLPKDADIYEKLDIMKRVRSNYMRVPLIYNVDSWFYIDSNHYQHDVNTTILKALDVYLAEKGY